MYSCEVIFRMSGGGIIMWTINNINEKMESIKERNIFYKIAQRLSKLPNQCEND